MTSLAPLAPMSRRGHDHELSVSDSEFGALLDDILDSPTSTSTSKKKSKNKKAAKRLGKDLDLSDSIGSLPSPNPKADVSERLNVPSPLKESFDAKESDILDDSILGGLSFGKRQKERERTTISSVKSPINADAANVVDTQSADWPTDDSGGRQQKSYSMFGSEQSLQYKKRSDSTKSREIHIQEESLPEVRTGVSLSTASENDLIPVGHSESLRSDRASNNPDRPDFPHSGDDDSDVGFMPSFLQPGRQKRSFAIAGLSFIFAHPSSPSSS